MIRGQSILYLTVFSSLCACWRLCVWRWSPTGERETKTLTLQVIAVSKSHALIDAGTHTRLAQSVARTRFGSIQPLERMRIAGEYVR